MQAWVQDPTSAVEDRFFPAWEREIGWKMTPVSLFDVNPMFKVERTPRGVVALDFETLEWGLARESDDLFHLHLIAHSRLLPSGNSGLRWVGECYQQTDAVPISEWTAIDGQRFKTRMTQVIDACVEELLFQFFGRHVALARP